MFTGSFISPVSADDIGPSHDLYGEEEENALDIDIEPAVDEDGEILTSDAAITYDITITTQNAKDTFPYIYPIDLEIFEQDDMINSQTVFLSPTQSEDYVPRYGDEEDRQEYELKETFQIYLTFNDQFSGDLDADNNLTRRLDFMFESRFTDDEAQETRNDDISGETPSGRSSSTMSITSTSGFDETSETTHVDRYRIQNSGSEGFLESFQIPSSDDFSGTVSNFQEMREPDSDGSTVISSEDNEGFNMITQTRNIPRDEPQTIAITYNILDTDGEIVVEPIGSDAESIDSATEYVLPDDTTESDYCSMVSSTNSLCLFALSNEEVEEINNLGEMYLEYDSQGEDISAEIFCQGIITGYMSSDRTTCGNSGIVDSDLIEITEFKGQQTDIEDTEPTSPVVPLDFRTDDESNFDFVDVNMYNSIQANVGEEETVDAEIIIVKEEGINTEELDEDYIVERRDVQIGEDEKTGIDLDTTIDADDILDRYVSVLCEPGALDEENCNYNDNIDYQELIFGLQGDDESPNVNVRDLIRLDLDVLDSERIIDERIQKQTTETNYDEDNDWYEIEDELIEDFTGEISERITIERTLSSDVSEYESDAISQLSNIEPEGEWDTDNYDTFISVNESETAYIPSSDSLNDPWVPTSAHSDRRAVTGEKSQLFDIRFGEEFASLTDSQRGWHLNRSAEVTDTIDDTTDTKIQHLDPDDCLNCLKVETMDEAENRFENTSDETLIQTTGDDLWERVSDEPYAIATLEEDEVEFKYRDTDLGDGHTRIYEGSEDSDVWRFSSYDELEIYEWERTNDIQQLRFDAPIYEDIREWQATWYDIEYVFTGDINQESDLHTYQRDKEIEINDWDPELEWYDFSDSHVVPESSGKSLAQVGISYEGISTDYTFDWIGSVHSKSPDEIKENKDEMCVDEPVQSEIPGGVGGVGMIQECELDSTYTGLSENKESVILVGKEYNQEGQFIEDITIWDTTAQSSTESIRVNVNEGAGTPDFDVEFSESAQQDNKNRADYRVDQIPFEGQINADTSDLGQEYELIVSPADTFEGVAGCPSGYESESNYDIQRQTQTTDLFRQAESCINDRFSEEPDNVPTEFDRFEEDTESEEITKYDIEEGAIQSCDGDALTSTNNEYECTILSDEQEELDEDTDIQYYSEQTGTLEVDGELFDYDYCPEGYNLETEESNNIIAGTCELQEDTEFDLKSRQLSIDYRQIQSGIVEQCSDIVTSSETGNHQGYMNSDDSGDEYCELVDPSDPGPSGFTIYDEDTGEYSAPPAGAIRGKQLNDDLSDSLDRCESFEEDDGSLLCNYQTETGEETIRYAEKTEGSWSYSSQSLDTLRTDSSDSQAVIWSSDYIMDDDVSTSSAEEKFKEVLNPRQIPFNEDDIGDTVTFEFTLQPSSGDGYVQSETVDVTICEAKSSTSLPRENTADTECDDFDTLMSGVSDFKADRTTISDAMAQYESEGEGTYEIESVRNDICPYNIRYPHNHQNIEPLSVHIDSSTTISDLEKQAKEHIQSRYSPNDPCLDEDDILRTPSLDSAEYTFNIESFRKPHTQDNIRRISAGDMLTIQNSPSVSHLSTRNGIGNALRLGTPVYDNDHIDGSLNPNNELLAMYTFDRDTENDFYVNTKDGEIPHGSAQEYKVSDMSGEALNDLERELTSDRASDLNEVYAYDLSDGLRDDFLDSQVFYHSRIWYTQPCESGDSSVITHTLAPEGTGITCPYEGAGYDSTVITDEDELDRMYSNVDFPSTQNQDIFSEQNAFLPLAPTEENYNNLRFDNTHEYDMDENYQDGIFGSNAIELDENSWLMITPPCLDEDLIGTDSHYGQSECNYDGGHSDLYLNGGGGDLPQRPDEQLNRKLAGENYTMTFYVRELAEPTTSISTDAEAHRHPVRTIMNIAKQGNEQKTMASRLELSSLTWPEDAVDYTGDTYDDESLERGIAWIIDERADPQNVFNDAEDYYIQGESNRYSWKHITVSYGESGTYSVYVDGSRITGNEPEDVRDVDEAEINDNSVISVGGSYLDIGMDGDDIYMPKMQSTGGNLLVDEIRIYDESIPNLEFRERAESTPEEDEFTNDLRNNQLDETIYYTENDGMYEGRIESRELDRDSYHKDIESFSPVARLSVNVDYELPTLTEFYINVIPCEDGSCDYDHAITLDSEEIDDNNGNIDAVFPESARTEIDTVDELKLDVTLRSPTKQATPLVREINMSVDSTPYTTCQEIQNRHNSFIGDELRMNTIQGGEVVETDCDFDTDGGGWTQFYWAEENVDYDTSTAESSLADCDINDDEACFTSANFDPYPTLDLDDYPDYVSSEDDLNPQILVKSISDGDTKQYAAFELTDYTTDEHNEISEYMMDYFSGDDVSNTRIPDTTDYQEECVYAFTSTDNYDSSCLNYIESSESGLAISSWNEDFDVDRKINIERNVDDNTVDSVECLGDDADRCEIYYRIGSSGDYPIATFDDFEDVDEFDIGF